MYDFAVGREELLALYVSELYTFVCISYQFETGTYTYTYIHTHIH